MEPNDARRTALEQLIDDAAVFPPARLPVPEALAQHAAHRARDEAWMLGRLLLPASKLELLGEPDGLRLGVVCDGPRFEDDLRRARATPDVTLEVLERRVGSVEEIAALESPVPVFVELAPGEDLDAGLDAIAAAGHGAKIRCGGVEPAAFPGIERVAAFVAGCRERELSFKATAGLHQPLRHHDGELDVLQHGFLNLLAATAFPGEEEHALAEQDRGALRLDADGLHWADRRADAEALAEARRRFVAFGSCSFDEPVEALHGLGVL